MTRAAVAVVAVAAVVAWAFMGAGAFGARPGTVGHGHLETRPWAHAPLIHSRDAAPVLYVTRDGIPAVTADEIKRLGDTGMQNVTVASMSD